MENIELKNFTESNLPEIKNWYTNLTEWKLWDAPWEEVLFNEDTQKANRLSRTTNSPCFEYEIFFWRKTCWMDFCLLYDR